MPKKEELKRADHMTWTRVFGWANEFGTELGEADASSGWKGKLLCSPTKPTKEEESGQTFHGPEWLTIPILAVVPPGRIWATKVRFREHSICPGDIDNPCPILVLCRGFFFRQMSFFH